MMSVVAVEAVMAVMVQMVEAGVLQAATWLLGHHPPLHQAWLFSLARISPAGGAPSDVASVSDQLRAALVLGPSVFQS